MDIFSINGYNGVVVLSGLWRRLSLSKVLKGLLEAFSGKEDAAFDCSERKTHMVGYFRILITGYIHCEGNPIVIGKFIDGF